MIDETFLHLPGVGPAAEAKLRNAGIFRWSDLLREPGRLPFRPKQAREFFELLEASQRALEARDLRFLAERLAKKELWRLLSAYRNQLSFFDIETNGLDQYAQVTVIGCYHRGELYHFIRGKNLDGFLDLLNDIELLVSFNGSTFDIPQLCKTWRIPDLGVPHIDLRWQCYHRHLRGGLKEIEPRLGIKRPRDLQGVDGEAAIWLWDDWTRRGDGRALDLLVRYCCADVLALSMLTDELLMQTLNIALPNSDHQQLWLHLDALDLASLRG